MASGPRRPGSGTWAVRTRDKGLNRFLGWCVDEGELKAHPMKGLDVPAAPAKPVPVLTDVQLVALLKATPARYGRTAATRL